MNNQVATTQGKGDLKSYFENAAIQKRFEQVLGSKAQAFIISTLSLAANTSLAKADPATVVNAAMTAATLDLPINQNLGFAYIVSYGDKAQFQMGYRGYIQLAMRSGQFKTINVSDVREGEIVKHNRLSGEITFDWKEESREKLSTIGYVAFFRLINGFEKSFYMTAQELKNHGLRYSANYKKYGSGLWSENFDAMAKKTVLKLLLSKYAPLTTQMQTAQLADQAIIKGEEEYEYVDNKPELPEKVAADKERERVTRFIENAKTTRELIKVSVAISQINDEELTSLYQLKEKELVLQGAETTEKIDIDAVDEGIKKMKGGEKK